MATCEAQTVCLHELERDTASERAEDRREQSKFKADGYSTVLLAKKLLDKSFQ